MTSSTVRPPAGTTTTDFDLDRDRDLRGRRSRDPWFRRLGLVVMGAVVVAALLGKFGQTEQVRTAESPSAAMAVLTPETLRGGLIWRARFTIKARQKIAGPTLVIAPGYVRGMQLNTIEPSPTSETNRGAGLAFTYPTMDAGDTLTVYLQLQANPTVVGKQDLSASFEGANIDPLRVPVSMRIFP